jgi:predicted nucleotidyltransferase
MRHALYFMHLALDVREAVLFGSYARGDADHWSDIDLLVVAPEFDAPLRRELIGLLWRVAARTDSRIEPVACGLDQWRTDTSSTVIELARREGQSVSGDA